MATDPWLPIGFALHDGQRLSVVLDSGSGWQIVDADQGRKRALVVLPSLMGRWVGSGLLNWDCAQRFEFGSLSFCAITSGPPHVLAHLSNCRSPTTKGDAMAFASALRETRAIDPDTSLHDGLYLEKLSRVLPTYNSDAKIEDDLVLGCWLTGGLNVSILPLRRIQKVLSWLNPESLKDVVESAGFAANEFTSSGGPEAGAVRAKRGPRVGGSDGEELTTDKRFQLPGRQVLEAFFNEHVVDIVQNRDRYRSLGIEFPPAIVLEGPPGCGKTFAVERLVEFLGWPLYSVEASSVASPYIHETSRKVAQIFEKAIEDAPCVVVIDEMEAFLADRNVGIGSSHHRVEEVAEFLRRIPEAVKKGVLIIGMTNRVDMIDQAILRRGRFDQIVTVDYAGAEEIEALLSSLLLDLPKSDDIDIAALARKLAGRPLSDVAYVIREGARLAARGRNSCLDNESLVAALLSTPVRDADASRGRMGFV